MHTSLRRGARLRVTTPQNAPLTPQPAPHSTHNGWTQRLLALATGILLLAGLGISSSAPASARSMSLGERAVAEASHHNGQPYRYGATGPSSFDCSGFTSYVYGHLGHSLPHNAASQYQSVRHIARSEMRPGDLVFISDGGSISHVGIYAGNNTWWHSPKSGDHVKHVQIYSSNYVVGRVG